MSASHSETRQPNQEQKPHLPKLPKGLQRLLGLGVITLLLHPTAAIGATNPVENPPETCVATLKITNVNDLSGDGTIQQGEDRLSGNFQVVAHDSENAWSFADEQEARIPSGQYDLLQEAKPGWELRGMIFFWYFLVNPTTLEPQQPSAPDATKNWQSVQTFEAKCHQFIRFYLMNHETNPTADDAVEEPTSPAAHTVWLSTVGGR